MTDSQNFAAPLIQTVQILDAFDPDYPGVSSFHCALRKAGFNIQMVTPDFRLKASQVFPTQSFANAHPAGSGKPSFHTAQATILFEDDIEILRSMLRRHTTDRPHHKHTIVYVGAPDGLTRDFNGPALNIVSVPHVDHAVRYLADMNRHARFGLTLQVL